MVAKHNGRAVPSDFLSQAMSLHRREKVPFPKGMKVIGYVKTLTAHESRVLTNDCIRPGKDITTDEDALDRDKLENCLMAAALVDGNGKRLIPRGNEADLDKLPSEVITAIQLSYRRMNEGETTSGN